MKAIVKECPGKGLVFKDVPVPEIGDEEVLVKVRSAGICGTDVHIYNWDKWSQNRIKPPLIIGHEFVGEVAELGRSVKYVSCGQRVSAEGHIACGHCEFCRTGQAHICRDVKIIGVDRDGCFAEYISISAGNLWPVPESIPDHAAAIFDPLGNAMHTVMAESVSGKSVLITGAGAIGLFAVAIARYAGASQIIVIEPSAYKREHARLAGADLLFDPGAEGIEECILDNTDGLGPQILLEMSGNPQAISQGFRLLRNGGCACILGIPPAPITIDWAKDIIFKGITIKAINGRRMYDTWFQSQNFMLKELKKINRLINHRLPFDQFEHGFDLLRNDEAVKVVLEMGK
ncbi:MAG: L-threonine 3-dehydrogenase [Candidatus Latescibacterota bacterium]